MASQTYEKSGANPPPYPQPGGAQYAPSTTQPATVVITTQGMAFGPDPQLITCPQCGHQVTTQVTPENGTLTWLLVGGLCLLGCWLGCCLIPTCCKDVQDANHYCPDCKTFLGKYRRM